MRQDGTCPKCESTDVIPDVRVLDRVEAADYSASSLTAVIYDKPEALFFKGQHRSTFRAYVCGACGFTEFYVNEPQELLAAHRKQGGAKESE